MTGFNRATKQELECLHRLNAPEMRALRVFFDNQLADVLKSLITSEGVHMHRLQGRAGYLHELLEAVQEAASALERGR
jgi:hypothetical protein